MANRVTVPITATDEGFKQTIQTLQQNAEKFADSLGKAGKQTNTFNGQLRTAKKMATELAAAYRQLDDEAKNSDFGRQMYAQMQEALKVAGEMTDLKKDVIQNINALASDTLVWDGMKQGIGVVSSGLQGLASIYGLCGGETKEFAKALVAVNAVQSVANTLVGIGNSLQKESALMTMLRTARSKLFTAQQITETAAVKAGTLAQLKLNLAVLANPYVAAAAAIAALCAGIYLWVNANDDVTESEKRKSEALQSLSDELQNSSNEVGKQIAAFKILQSEYQRADGDLATMKANMSNFDEVCKAANLTLKKQSDAEVVLSKLAPLMVKKYQIEARAAAASAAAAAEYGKILAKVAEIQKRIAAGETIDEGDLKALNIDPSKVGAIFKREGGLDDMFASVFQPSAQDLKYIGSNLEKDMQNLATLAIDAFDDKFNLFANISIDAQKELADISEKFKAEGVDLSKVYNAGTVKESTTKAAKHVKKTSKEVNILTSTIEGCDNVIKKAQQDITKLDHNSSDFLSKLIKLNAIILSAKQSKFELIDRSTIQGMKEAKILAQDILQYLEVGSEDYEKWNDEVDKLNESMYEYLNSVAKSGSSKALKDVQSHVEDIIANLPEGSAELNKWVAIWKEINNKIETADERIGNLKAGIEQGSLAQIDQEISKLKRRLENENLELSVRAEIEWEIEKLEQQKANINPEFVIADQKPIDITFDYKKTELEKVQRDLDHIQERWNYLQELKKDKNTPDWGLELINDQIDKLAPKLQELRSKARLTELNEDFKEIKKTLATTSYDAFAGGIEGLHSMYDAIDGLSDKIDNAKNAFEQFFAIFDAIFSIVDTILSMVETFNALSQAITAFSAISDTSKALNGENAASTAAEAAATEGLVAAKISEAAAETAALAPKEASAEASSQAAIAQMDLAAANIAAAHSEIPFVGPALAAAGIATVTAAVAAAHGTMMGLQAFESGGIVRGSTTMGDSILIRANAGEMILNNRQQESLFKIINNGSISSENSLVGTTIKVKGSDLFLSLKNYSKITNKTL